MHSTITRAQNKGTIAFEVPAGVKAYTYLAKLNGKSVTVKQFDAKGNEVASEEVNTPLFKQTIKPGAVKVALTGNAEIYEIVPSK